jgi:deoxyribose-phosphate aldolase
VLYIYLLSLTLPTHYTLSLISLIAQIADIERMVAEGRTGYGPVAAYCVYPHFNSAIHNGPNGAEHQPTIAIANVINFPQGKLFYNVNISHEIIYLM